MKEDHPLTPKEHRLVIEYLKDLNGAQAAIRAGFNPSSARTMASHVLAKNNVQAFLRKEQEHIARKIEIETIDVLRGLIDIIEADPNEIVEHRRTCCRFCWSFGLGYKRTPEEMRIARLQHEKDELERQRLQDPPPPTPFDEAGGSDYNATLDPDPDCPECFGEGVGTVFVKDTRTMSPAARALYAGAKQTKAGVEIQMHSKEKARELLGKHLGLFRDVVDVNDSRDLANRIVEARKRSNGHSDDG